MIDLRTTHIFHENLKAYNEGYRVIVNKGGSRSGKTHAIVMLLDMIALNYPDHLKISIVSSTFPRVKSGPVYELEKYFLRCGINNKAFHNKSDHQFIRGKSIIEYYGVDNYEKVIGPGRDILFLNEANIGITFETYVQLRQRTSRTIFIDYNPSSEYWLQKQGILKDKRTRVIHSTYLDNIDNLTDHQVKDFEDAKGRAETSKYWAYWWNVYGLGQDSVLIDERIMPFLNKVDELPGNAVQIPSGLDFGFNPDPLAFAKMWIVENENDFDDLYIQEVVYQTRLSINSKSPGSDNFIDILEKNNYSKGHLIISESAEPRNINEIRDEGYDIVGVKKESVEHSIKLFHNYNLHFLPDSENAYNEFDNYKYKVNRDGEILGIPTDGQADHIIDSVRYVLMNRGVRW